jgi:O-antigen biosynthesis protein WbqP
LSGWAQINGRDEISIEEKARLDGIYVKNVNFFFDCKCFFRTVGSVLKAEGFVEGENRYVDNKREIEI